MRALSSRFDVWFCDVWGVVHNGYEPFADAVDALRRHRAAGGTVVLLTNSPRSSAGVERQLAELKVPRDCWDIIVTSGDVTRTLMVSYSQGKVFHLGPDRDLSLFEDLSVERVALDHARAVVCTGLFREFEETPEDYLPQLRAMLHRSLPMICANPDKVVRKGDQLIACAGAIAGLYAELGGTVHMAGKPFRPIYELAMSRAGTFRGEAVSMRRVLAIGDGLATDIRGAADFGIPAVVITGGINEGGDISAAVRQAAPDAKIEAMLADLLWF